MKACTKCKQNKDETCFGKRAATKKDGLDYRCKECRSKYKKERTIKRNKKRKEETLPDGMKRCANTPCNKILPLSEFKSTKERRTEPTTTCNNCRASLKKSKQNPTSTTGKCKEWWQNWKKTNPCQYEGGCEYPNDWRLIQADHIDPKAKKRKRTGEKGHSLGDYTWWACKKNGGVEAMKEEAKKCQALCIFHHKIKTKDERRDQTQKSILEKRARINEKKRERGECLKCEMKCVEGNEFLFDLDHRDEEEKTIAVSQLVYKSGGYFNKQLPLEMAKCDLLCCGCHTIKTHY
jgi:hypothetical protein